VAALAAIVGLAACGGAGGNTSTGSSVLPNTPHATQEGAITITLKVPAAAKQLRPHIKGKLLPMNESPATQGVGISLALAPATPPPVQTPNYAFDLSNCASNCVTNPDGSRTYTLTTGQVSVGTYTILIATWDQPPVSNHFNAGNELSDAQTSQAISTTNSAINVTLNGIPSSVNVSPVAGQTHVVLDAASVWNIIGNIGTQWNAVALDADGFIITGSGAPLFTFTDGTGSFTFTPTATQGTYTITAQQAQPSSVPVSVTATGLGPSGVVSAPSTLPMLPVQELWTAAGGGSSFSGIYGYPLYPSNNYLPQTAACCFNSTSVDSYINSASTLLDVAEDSSGALWAFDTTALKLEQFAISSSGGPLTPTGVALTGAGTISYGLAGDANGFLYSVDASNLYVFKVVGTTPALKYTVPLSAPPQAVAVVPSTPVIPAALRGAIVIGDTNGLDFYSNASTGAPTHLGMAGTEYGGVVGVGIAPDDGTLWAEEQTEGYELSIYSLTSATSVNFVNSTSINYVGALAAGIADFAYAGADSMYYPVIEYGISEGTPVQNNSEYIGNGAGPTYYGAYIVP
jgi:hypothetical protein